MAKEKDAWARFREKEEAPAERHHPIGQPHEAVIGDGNPVSIGAEVMQDMLRASEGRLRVDDPIGAIEVTQPGREGFLAL